MPDRKTHNKYAYGLMKKMLSMEEIDDVNRIMDAPSQIYGSQHRKYYGHNRDPTAKDSLEINRGSAKREMARQVHLILDTDRELQKIIKLKELDRK